MAGEILANVINKMVDNKVDVVRQNLTDVVYGNVVSVKPLKINVNDRLTIEEDFIMLSPFCSEFSITIPGIGKIDLWGNLSAGERVVMLRMQNKYYILERK